MPWLCLDLKSTFYRPPPHSDQWRNVRLLQGFLGQKPTAPFQLQQVCCLTHAQTHKRTHACRHRHARTPTRMQSLESRLRFLRVLAGSGTGATCQSPSSWPALHCTTCGRGSARLNAAIHPRLDHRRLSIICWKVTWLGTNANDIVCTDWESHSAYWNAIASK